MIRSILFVFLSFCFVSVFSQEEGKAESAPLIITKMAIGKSMQLGDYTIKFVEVIEDSRCPSDVTCVWAGEAKVKVLIHKGEEIISEKTITIGANGVDPIIAEILKTENNTLLGYNLSPYPKTSRKIPNSEYMLGLILR